MKASEPHTASDDPALRGQSGASAFQTADAPRWEDYSRCVHCGLCLNACPTFRVLGEEMDSPRGRIYQVAQADAGRLPLSAIYTHLDRCLDCRACETACPSGVEYGRILERARAELHVQIKSASGGRLKRALLQYFLGRVLPSRRAVAMHARLLRVYQRSGLQRLARASGLLKLLGAEPMDALAPTIDAEFFTSAIGKTFAPNGRPRSRVAFLAGCMQNVVLAGMNRATVSVLQRNGCEVTIPVQQTCCGALQVHAGMRDFARTLARRTIAAFDGPYDFIVTNTAGCGANLKEYGDLFEADPQWAERARHFAAKVRDVTELLDQLGVNTSGLGPLPLRVTYQDPCHLAHAQRIRFAPRNLLASIPAIELIEMERSDQCCGSAGIYNLLQPEIAGRLLDDKLHSIAATHADAVVTANPGCMLQIAAGLRRRGSRQPVMHVVEVLEQSYRAGANVSR